MVFPQNVAIVGLGLMGGSLARDLARSGIRVMGRDRSDEVSAAALRDGVISEVLSPTLERIDAADLVVIATPVDQAADVLATLARSTASKTIITDLGSTKAQIVAEAERLGVGPRFVGSHPLAGDHRSGWDSSRSGLYNRVAVYLCPSAATQPSVLESVRSFWSGLGAISTTLDASEHDELMAWVSHLPQVVSSAIAGALAEAGRVPGELGPGGRDMTRLAGSSPEMWEAICLSNAVPISSAIALLRGHLEGIEEAVRRGDASAIRKFFLAGRDWLEP